MDTKYDWIHELIKTEELMEESGVIDMNATPIDTDRALIGAALTFLTELKKEFHEALEIFNDLKHHSTSKIKLYGIAKTPADFMLFRNGLKLIFSLKQPGVISIRTHFMNPGIPAVSAMQLMGSSIPQPISSPRYQSEEALLEMKWGVFDEVMWTYKNHAVKIESIVKHYLTQFIRDSTGTV